MILGDDEYPGFPGYYTINERRDQVTFARLALYGDYNTIAETDDLHSESWQSINLLGRGINQRKRLMHTTHSRIFRYDMFGD
jgi:hypothetical protein